MPDRNTGTGEKNIVDTLKTGMRHFKRRFWIIILAGVIYIAFFVLSLEITRMTEATIRIGLNYPSSSSGLNPNNTKFSVSEILDDDVLEAAIVKGGFSGVTAEELKGCLLVTPVDDGETISIDQYYISTEYNLEYAASWKTRSLDPEKVVNSVAECYYEKFIQMYSRKPTYWKWISVIRIILIISIWQTLLMQRLTVSRLMR